VRDPTVFIPRSQLATPSGIDHDYNFLHSIEHRIERSEKEIIEDRRLVGRDELKVARDGEDATRRREREEPGEACIHRILRAYKIRVFRAPKGMRRNVENTTSWSRKSRSINWQVEWIREGASERLLAKALGHRNLGHVFAEIMEEERKVHLTANERKTEKKRRAEQNKERYAKRLKLERQNELDMTTISRLQNTQTGAWRDIPSYSLTGPDDSEAAGANLHFFLHRPNTPSSFAKVLVPLDHSRPLLDQLRKRELNEFPTIYVQEHDTLPEHCMLEKDFLKATGLPPINPDESSSSEEPSGDDDTSTSGSDSSDVEMEEGEIR